MSTGPKRYIATYSDDSGIPRAFGVGGGKLHAIERARTELHAYVQKKRALGEPVRVDDYTLSVKEESR